MSDDVFDDLFGDDFDEPESEPQKVPVPKALREWAKRVKQENDDLKAKLADGEKKARDRELKSFIKEKKLDPGVTEMIGDQDPEEWFEKFGKYLAVNDSSDDAGQENEKPPGSPQPNLTPEQIEAAKGVTEMQPGPSSTPTPRDLVETRTTQAAESAQTIDDFWASLEAEGALAKDGEVSGL